MISEFCDAVRLGSSLSNFMSWKYLNYLNKVTWNSCEILISTSSLLFLLCVPWYFNLKHAGKVDPIGRDHLVPTTSLWEVPLSLWVVESLSHVWLFGESVDCSPLGSSVHGLLLVRILEWITMPASKGSSQPENRTWVFCVSCIAAGFFGAEPLGKPIIQCI